MFENTKTVTFWTLMAAKPHQNYMSSYTLPTDEFESAPSLDVASRLLSDEIYVNDEHLDESLDRPDRITFDQVLTKILARFWKAECAHRFKLKIMTMMKDALQGVLNPIDLKCVFNQLDNRVYLSNEYYSCLRALQAEGRFDPEPICSTILSYMSLFRLYQTVAAGYQSTLAAAKRIQSLAVGTDVLRKFDLRLESLMNVSVHRVARLLMTLVRLYRLHDNFNIPIESNLLQATMTISNLTSEIEGLLSPMKSKGNQLLQAIQREIFGNRFCIFNSSRYVIRQGKLLKLRRRRMSVTNNTVQCLFLLCNDLLLYGCMDNDGRKATVSRIIAIGGLSVKPLSATTIQLASPVVGIITVIAASTEESQQWIDDVRITIEMDAIRRRCLQTKSALQRAFLQKSSAIPDNA